MIRSNLRRRRVAAGLTVAGLAARAGLSRQHVYNLEAGKYRPNIVLAQRLAAAVGATVDEVFPPAEQAA